MFNDKTWSPKAKVVVYCPIGRAVEMADFSIKNLIENTGLPDDEWELVFLTWKTAPEAYAWIDRNHFKNGEANYDEGKGFLWNLYKCGWNFGYDVAFKHADYAIAVGTDHAYAKNWLANLMKNAKPNRLTNCKLIEPGVVQTIHQAQNFGFPTTKTFNLDAWNEFSTKLAAENKDKIHLNNEVGYGRRYDASPFVMPHDVWERFGPMNQTVVPNSPDPMGIYVKDITGDTDFFNRVKSGGVEVCKALDAISFHWGAGEASSNHKAGVYT